MKDCLLNYSYLELENVIKEMGQKSFRAEQIYTSLNLGLEFSEMTTLSKDFRSLLEQKYSAFPVKIIETLVSSDGTQKFLFLLLDGNVIEGVLMKYKYGNTLCIL